MPKGYFEPEEILNLLDTLRFKDWEDFVYRDTHFLLLFTSAEHCPEGASHEVSTFLLDDGFDIYISEDLAGTALKRAVFHEIVEAIVGMCVDDREKAHATALEQEEEAFGPRE